MAKGSSPFLGFGMGVGSVNVCKTEDQTFYCQFTRVFHMFLMTLIVCYVAYIVYVMFLSKHVNKLFSSRGR
jgi:hypothetical protein